ncbi:hypothetical protein PPL_05978 [Heterostelium album PN500]|uniref:Uncharacterized protein n=1 Tax=Heterostelium pallidum (strain ATCC 26659 / Pp 5 / PN500) TaxID=670386 RepID=D3BBV8_HETP5|nr:hypothetical protein PPL_05978 [Heterostelium album PN500]EFA81141.1 hypothetical protein PPL_05978 [Heterostelium album PN500]|eukprot:XP_020433259.1 hypothetical protein PPL_05978 [Heterostelium album PN500]
MKNIIAALFSLSIASVSKGYTTLTSIKDPPQWVRHFIAIGVMQYLGLVDQFKWGPSSGFGICIASAAVSVFGLLISIIRFGQMVNIRVQIPKPQIDMATSVTPTQSPVQTWSTTNPYQTAPIQPNLIVPAEIEIDPKSWYRIVPITIPVLGPNGVPSHYVQHNALKKYDSANPDKPVVLPNGPNIPPKSLFIQNNLVIDRKLWYQLAVKEIPVMGPNDIPTHYRSHYILQVSKENGNENNENKVDNTTKLVLMIKPKAPNHLYLLLFEKINFNYWGTLNFKVFS